jgi:hypothetical protein
MRRRFFTILSAVSLLLCVLTTAIWLHSIDSFDSVTWTKWEQSNSSTASIQQFRLHCDHSRMSFASERSTFTSQALILASQKYLPSGTHFYHFRSDNMVTNMSDQRLWIAGTTTTGPGRSGTVSTIQLPAPVLIFVLAVFPTWWLLKVRRLRSHPVGSCKTCGYDLRATPDRCPECGTRPAKLGAKS